MQESINGGRKGGKGTTTVHLLGIRQIRKSERKSEEENAWRKRVEEHPEPPEVANRITRSKEKRRK